MVHLHLVADDRRERAREKKRRAVLDAADGLLGEVGLAGLTMQGVADRLDWAVGTLYNYVPSKAALVAALQGEAVAVLRSSFELAATSWDDHLAGEQLPEVEACLVRLCAFGAHWTAASVVFADEFALQRGLLTERVEPSAADDARAGLQVLETLLANPARLLGAAVDLGVLEPADGRERALMWLAALDGVLLLDRPAALDKHLFRAQHLARTLTRDLLCGWGADRLEVEVADGHVDRLAALGPLAPPPDRPGFGR